MFTLPRRAVASTLSTYRPCLENLEERTVLSGNLDPRFGLGGASVLNVNQAAMGINAVAATPDGKTVMAGTLAQFDANGNETGSLLVTRLNRDGSPDASFGQGGQVSVPVGPLGPGGVAVTPEGKIVIVGEELDPNTGIPIVEAVRLNPSGSLDSAFGTGGVSLVSNNVVIMMGMALAPDGKLYVAGNDGSSFNQVDVFRLSRNGAIDPTYGNQGMGSVSIADGFSPGSGNGLALTPGGRVVVVGSAQVNGTDSQGNPTFRDAFAVARLTRDGLPDPSFGDGSFGPGVVLVGGNGNHIDGASGVAVTDDGQIVIAGIDNVLGSPVTSLAVARLNRNGGLDQGFGSGGMIIVTPGLGVFGNEVTVALGQDDQIIVAGTGIDPNYSNPQFPGLFQTDLAVVQIQRNGQLDPRFGSGGVVLTPASPAAASPGAFVTDVIASGLAVLPDGRIVVGGQTLSGSFDANGNLLVNVEFMAVRYMDGH